MFARLKLVCIFALSICNNKYIIIMKTLITLFRKVLGLRKSESEMTIDEYIESVQNRKQQLSNISFSVDTNLIKHNDDFEAAGNLVLA